MPDMNPVGNTGIVPDPNRGIGLLSSILGVQQQRQNLATGAIEQQRVQAATTQEQQKNAEMQAAQGLAINGAKSGKYTNPDGSLNRQQLADDITKVAPTYGMGIAGQMLSHANEIVSNQQAHQNLNRAQQEQLGSGIGSLATKSDLSPSDFIDELDRQVAMNPDPKFRRMALSMAASIPSQTGTPQQLQDLARRWATAAVRPETGISTSLPGQTTNAANQILNRQPVSGALSAPPGGTLGGPLNPSAPTVAAATTTAAGAAAGDNERNSQISNLVTPSRSSITLADQVAKLSDEVRTGKFSSAVTNYAATIGQKDETIAARQLLSKYAAQLKTQGISNAPSDSARLQIEAGLPDPDTMSPEAIKGAAEFVKGGMLMNLSRAANARKFQATHGNTQGLRNADDQLTTNADPLMYTYQNLKPGAERQEFIRRHFNKPEDAADFVRRKNAVEHFGGFAQ